MHMESFDALQASDVMRTYAIKTWEFLMDSCYYGHFDFDASWVPRIVEESILIMLNCWKHLYDSDGSNYLIPMHETLRVFIKQECPPEFSLSLSGRLPESASPLEFLAIAHPSEHYAETTAQPVETEPSDAEGLVARREALLSEYKSSTGASHKKIYEAQNSGVHKPEFYSWRNGKLPASSKTAKTFEAFLRAKRRPVPRKPTS